MSFLRRIPPGLWLLVVTLSVVVAFVASTVYSSHLAGNIDAMAADISGNADPSIRYLGDARTQLHEIGSALTESAFEGKDVAALRRRIQAHEDRLHGALDAYAALPFFPTERGSWQLADLDLREVEASSDEMLALLEAHDVAGAIAERTGPLAAAIGRADAALDGIVAFDADQGSRLSGDIEKARNRAQTVVYALDAAAVVFAGLLGAAAIASTRQHMALIREQREAETRSAGKLRLVASSAVSLSERLGGGVRELLQEGVEAARTVAGGDMAVLGIGTDPDRPFDPFVFDGMEPGLLDRLGPPHPRGLLGAPLRDGRSVRIDDAQRDARATGMPDLHPPVGPMLAVAVRRGSERVGALYVGRTPGRGSFSEEDAGALELLAEFVGTAMQNATLYGSLHDEVRAREDLLAMVSHDLRNPLSAMSMAATLAQRRTAAGAPVVSQLELIARNAERMDRLIGDLLTAAKLQQGRLSIDVAPRDPGALVRDAVEAFAPAAAARHVRLSSEIADGLAPVRCDAGRIAQCLGNFLSNALKFTPDGGSVVVSVGRRGAQAGELAFAVRDTGPGLAEGDLAHVFDRYWQKKRDAARGTGLGLYICKGIVEAHGGRIWATSRPGEGSEFCFTLPAAEA